MLFSISQEVVVERSAWELSKLGNHPILNGEHVGINPIFYEPLEKTPCIFGLKSIFANNSRGQLLVIAHQNHFLRLALERYQDAWFCCLAGFVDNQARHFVSKELCVSLFTCCIQSAHNNLATFKILFLDLEIEAPTISNQL